MIASARSIKPKVLAQSESTKPLSIAEVLKRHNLKLTPMEIAIVGTKVLAAYKVRYPRTRPAYGVRKPTQQRRRVYAMQDWDLVIDTAKTVLSARPQPPQSNIVPMRRTPDLTGAFYRSTDPADPKTFVYVYRLADHTAQSYEVFIATLVNDFWQYSEDLFNAGHLASLELLEPESNRWIKANAAFVNALNNEIIGARHLMGLFKGGGN